MVLGTGGEPWYQTIAITALHPGLVMLEEVQEMPVQGSFGIG
jgi:hypothetical protein